MVEPSAKTQNKSKREEIKKGRKNVQQKKDKRKQVRIKIIKWAIKRNQEMKRHQRSNTTFIFVKKVFTKITQPIFLKLTGSPFKILSFNLG